MLPPNFLIPAGIVIKNAKTYVAKLFSGNIWPEAGNASYLMGLPIIKIYPGQPCKVQRNLFVTQKKRITGHSGSDTSLEKGWRVAMPLTGSHPWVTAVSLCELGEFQATSASLLKDISNTSLNSDNYKVRTLPKSCRWQWSCNFYPIISGRQFILRVGIANDDSSNLPHSPGAQKPWLCSWNLQLNTQFSLQVLKILFELPNKIKFYENMYFNYMVIQFYPAYIEVE